MHLTPRMAILFVTAVAFIALFTTWYVVSLRRKREKAREILRWIQASLAGRGHVVGISWTAASRFRVPLRLTCGVFRSAWVLVEMRTHETPVHWLIQKISSPREVLTFQADLDFPPTFSLEMQNFRWFARSSRKAKCKGGRDASLDGCPMRSSADERSSYENHEKHFSYRHTRCPCCSARRAICSK